MKVKKFKKILTAKSRLKQNSKYFTQVIPPDTIFVDFTKSGRENDAETFIVCSYFAGNEELSTYLSQSINTIRKQSNFIQLKVPYCEATNAKFMFDYSIPSSAYKDTLKTNPGGQATSIDGSLPHVIKDKEIRYLLLYRKRR